MKYIMTIALLSLVGGHLKGQEKSAGRKAGRLLGGKTVTYSIPNKNMVGKVNQVEKSWVDIPVSPTRLKSLGDIHIKKGGEYSPFKGERLRLTNEGLSMEVSFKPGTPGTTYSDTLEVWSSSKNRREFVIFLTGQSSTEASEERIAVINFPNPFQRITTILFHLKRSGSVTLDIHNMQGAKITTLTCNERLEAGDHRYEFDGTPFSAGIYYVHLLLDNRPIGMSKMLLVR